MTMTDETKIELGAFSFPPNVCIITQAGREVARVPIVPVEGRPGEYRYQLPPMEPGSYLVDLVYEPPETT